MAKLNQIIAVEKGKKTSSYKEINAIHKTFQKPALFNAVTRKYTPLDAEGETLPDEVGVVTKRTSDLIAEVRSSLGDYFDVTATKDWGNCSAVGSVVVDGETLLANVPITYLLFLEKQLTDMKTLLSLIPTLPSDQIWNLDTNDGLWKTPATKTNRTKKVLRNHLVAEATDKHPAQVTTYSEDQVIGHFESVHSSSAWQKTQVAQISTRVNKLLEAVKFAREEANSIEVDDIEVSETLFDYIFG